MSPYWANKLAQPVKTWLNQKGWPHVWLVDDILLLGNSKEQVENRAAEVINLLTELGMQINPEKCMTQASQNVEYNGQMINLKANMIEPITEKTEHAKQITKKQLQSNVTTPKYVAALAGIIMDCMKSNNNIQGLPQQLMRCAQKW